MDEHANDPGEYDLDEELELAEAWSGELDVLEGLVETISSAWTDRDLDVVSTLCMTLLKHDELPALYRGRFSTYMSFVSGEDPAQRLDEASFWLHKAATEASGDIHEIEEWQSKVKGIQDRLVWVEDDAEDSQNPGNPDTTLALHGLLDGTTDDPQSNQQPTSVEDAIVSEEQKDVEIELPAEDEEPRGEEMHCAHCSSRIKPSAVINMTAYCSANGCRMAATCARPGGCWRVWHYGPCDL
ncbi:hypothetical protein LTR27_002082 [Elasticomyces elasticus]|nr:hypothetical protein LTR27_002082 [Elasticomyces elasticus]